MNFEERLRMGDFARDLNPIELPIQPNPQTCSEITVTIKDEEKTLKTKFLIYDKYEVNDNDPIIKDCVARTLKDFGGDPTNIKVRINLEIL